MTNQSAMSKKLIIITIILLMLILSIYFFINNIVHSNYQRIYNSCINKAQNIQYELNNSENNYPYKTQAVQCIDKGGCWEDCGSGCGLPERPSSNPFKSLQQYWKIKRSNICLAVCRQGCIYPLAN